MADKDQHIDKSIRSAFDKRSLKAPDIWPALDSEMSAIAQNQALDASINQAFDPDHSTKKAPNALWSGIQSDLNVSTESLMDQKIKTVYEQQDAVFNTKNSTWNSIQRQLNVDKAWNQIQQILDKHPVITDHRSKMFRFLLAASVLLLFFRTCTPLEYKNDTDVLAIQDSVLLQKEMSEAHEVKSNHQASSINSDAESAMISKEDHHESTSNQGHINTPELPNASREVDRIQSKVAKSDISKTKLADLKHQPFNTILHDRQSHETSEHSAVVHPILAQMESVAPDTKSTFDTNALLTLEPNNISVYLQENNPPKASSDEKPMGKLSIGTFLVMNSTMILKNQTREGFNSGSHVENVYGFAGNYGLWMNYRISEHSDIIAEFSLDAVSKQSYNVFFNGAYYNEEWIFKQNRVLLGYKHRFNIIKGLKPSSVFLQSGIYAAYLREANLYYNGELMFDGLAMHKRFDMGLNLIIGHEIYLDRLVLQYGFRTDLGVLDIFNEHDSSGNSEDPTNILNMGAYIGLGYRF